MVYASIIAKFRYTASECGLGSKYKILSHEKTGCI